MTQADVFTVITNEPNHPVVYDVVLEGRRCTYHPAAPAIRCIGLHGEGLCAVCCEDLAQQLVFGLTPDPVQAQWDQERQDD